MLETPQSIKRIACCDRRILVAIFLCLPAIASLANDPGDIERTIETAHSFAADARLSVEKNLPIVVFVSQHDCQYCALLRSRVLHPMLRAGQFDNNAILREVSLDDGFFVEGFAGEEVAGKNFAGKYAAAVTPTLLFLGSDGSELAPKLVGINNIEFYSFYLERSLDAARAKLHARH